jgi:hypothetical protein
MKMYMGLSIILFLFILLSTPQIVYADAQCIPLEKLKEFFNKAVVAEKAGELIEALNFYRKAEYRIACGGVNPNISNAEKGWRRVGQRLGEEAEKKGDLYSGPIITYHFDEYDIPVIEGDHGAFNWFDMVRNFADADRVMMKLARSTENIETFDIALNHFKGRQQDEYLKEHNYSFDPGYLKELENIASKNGDKALEKEKKAFGNIKAVNLLNQKEVLSVEESQNQLRRASEWFSFFGGVKAAQVVKLTEIRGDTLYADDNEPGSLEKAIGYYEISNNQERIKRVKEKAAKLGDRYAKKDELTKAIEYYEIAGNRAKAKELQGLLKERRKRQIKEMFKDEKQQKKFKKEQEDLEKELGL